MGMMGGSMMGGGMMPAMHAQVEDVDHGARLKMTPADATKLNEMRQHREAARADDESVARLLHDGGRRPVRRRHFVRRHVDSWQ